MLEEFLNRYTYRIPEHLVRKVPLSVRHESKLLVYDTKKDLIYHDTFLFLYKYLPENSHLILNKTQVVPARLNCVGKMGGKYELFLVLNEWSGTGDISCFTGRPFGYGKPKKLYLQKDKNIAMTVYKNKEDGITYLKNEFKETNDLIEFLKKYGETPVPHYLEDKNHKLEEEYIRERYQTVFAEEGRSVAAPTASLHFTDEVFKRLHAKNIHESYVTLDIGRGTFSNLKESNLKTNTLHKEKYYIGNEVRDILENKKINKVVVGTTVCRTVESFGKTGKLHDETDVFIHDDFDFKYTDTLITNFHQPETSLMALVDSFLKHKKSKKTILDLYKIAIDNNYSFYSFGDSMLIL